MHGRLQFGMRENPASNRRHGSRLAVHTPSDLNCVEKVTTKAPSLVVHDGGASEVLAATPNAGPNQAATRGIHNDTARPIATNSGLKLSKMSEHPFEPLISSPQAAKLLGNIHVKTLQRYARRGDLPGYQIGGHWYFRASDLDVWLQSRVNSRPPTR
jgi:excisionase family DNA binding protein